MVAKKVYMDGRPPAIRLSTDDNIIRNGAAKKYRRACLLLLLFVLLLLAGVIVLIVVLVHRINIDNSKQKDPEVCYSSHCINTASRILSAMNTKVDPCENFYEFACGQWVDTHQIPEDKGAVDQMELATNKVEYDLQALLEERSLRDEAEYITKAKSFYRSCMNEGAVDKDSPEEVKQFITDIGGFPVLESNWDESKFNLEKSIAMARRLTTNNVWPIPSGIMIGLNVLNDYKVYGKHVIYFDQPTLLLDGRDVYVDENSDVFAAYVKYATELAVAVGADERAAAEQMKDVVDYEIELAKITVSIPDRRNSEKNYRRMNVSSLSLLYPQFDWLTYLHYVYEDTGVIIAAEEPVILWMKAYFDELFDLLNRTSNRTIANYITLRLLHSQNVAMEKKIQLMRLEFEKVTRGFKVLKPRGRKCSEVTNRYLELATGRMYAQKRFGEKEKDHMIELISYLRRMFKEIVTSTDWMDSNTKTAALSKIESMKSLIGFPASVYNDSFLLEKYKNYNITEEESFLKILIHVKHLAAIKQLKELREPSYERWPSRPAIVNAFYHNGLNAIVFPAGILQPPYYDFNYPASINFGGIGLVIGHEITHGYDATGRAFDSKGLLHNWWSDFSMCNFNAKAKCVIDHYAQFVVPSVNLNINGNNTLSENIADIGGVKLSHMAFRLWLREHNNADLRLPGLNYTHEQLFFLNTAQLWCSKFSDAEARRSVLTGVHSLPMFRVIGELRNSDGFSEAYQCPKGTYMNPDEPKCSLW